MIVNFTKSWRPEGGAQLFRAGHDDECFFHAVVFVVITADTAAR